MTEKIRKANQAYALAGRALADEIMDITRKANFNDVSRVQMRLAFENGIAAFLRAEELDRVISNLAKSVEHSENCSIISIIARSGGLTRVSSDVFKELLKQLSNENAGDLQLLTLETVVSSNAFQRLQAETVMELFEDLAKHGGETYARKIVKSSINNGAVKLLGDDFLIDQSLVGPTIRSLAAIGGVTASSAIRAISEQADVVIKDFGNVGSGSRMRGFFIPAWGQQDREGGELVAIMFGNYTVFPDTATVQKNLELVPTVNGPREWRRYSPAKQLDFKASVETALNKVDQIALQRDPQGFVR